MSYQRKDLQILGGGFNCLPPADKVPKTDYLLAQNWRTDRAGKLVSRPGQPLTGSGFAWPQVAYLHSGAFYGQDVYWAGNTAGPNSGFLFHGVALLASGLSGGRVGMVPMNGWMWIMDPQLQDRHNNTGGLQPWGVAAPNSACNAAAGAGDPTGPNGTYTFYVTFETADGTYETNPGPASSPVTVALQDISLTAIPTYGGPGLWSGIHRNIYASGGNLGQAYLVATIADNSSTTLTLTFNDLSVTNQGIEMSTTNDLPPTCSGLGGPYYNRLIAWNSVAHPNRFWWTDPGKPQYFPGSADPADGNWSDVGADGEAILWCTFHANVMVIYKERSIWWLVGDPDTGYLESIDAGLGLVNPWAVAQAGQTDYFVAPGGLYQTTLSPAVIAFGAQVLPLFQSNLTNNGALTPPGRVQVAVSTPFNYADCSLGWGMGKLYLSYSEQGQNSGVGPTLVYNGERWMYYRNSSLTLRNFGFLFGAAAGATGGAAMWAMSGQARGGVVVNLEDFELASVTDFTAGLSGGTLPIECVYQSHYEDAGLPDNQKSWIEVVIDYEFAGDTATVYAGLLGAGSNASTTIPLTKLGTITGNSRQSASFALGIDSAGGALVAKTPTSPSTVSDGALGKSISVAIDCQASNLVTIHNVYLYYYEEARLGLAASTLPLDLGSGKVKQCKELELDIDASNGTVSGSVYSDLPGNALAVRQPVSVAKMGGRGVLKFPFSITEGFLWRLALNSLASFRLYHARLLMRVVGVYVEAYESAAGFVWDSQEMTFDSGIVKIPRMYAIALGALPIKRFRELRLEIDTFGGDVIVSFLTDLPGEAQAVRFSQKINTGAAGRRFVPIVMASGTAAPIEGRLCRIQLSGGSKFILYDAAVEVLAVGEYIAPADAAAGAVYDSREQDFGSQKPKEARELELDIETTGAVTATLYTDLPGLTMAQVYSHAVTTNGRQQIKLPLTVNALQSLYPMGRLLRLILSGANAFRLYGAKLKVREFGTYLTGDEASGGAVWDSTPLDLDIERVKAYKKLELDIQTDSATPATVTILTSQSGTMVPQYSKQISTNGARMPVVSYFPPGLRGRLVEVQVSGTGVRLFAGKLWWRPMNETDAKWQWTPLPIVPTPPQWADAPLPVNPTPPGGEPAQWWWAKVLSVEDTPDVWQWVDVPFEVRE